MNDSQAKARVTSLPPIKQAADAYLRVLLSDLLEENIVAPRDDVERGGLADWEAIYRIERHLLIRAGKVVLQRRAWIVRNRYREVAGEPKYALYTASNPPNVPTAAAAAVITSPILTSTTTPTLPTTPEPSATPTPPPSTTTPPTPATTAATTPTPASTPATTSATPITANTSAASQAAAAATASVPVAPAASVVDPTPLRASTLNAPATPSDAANAAATQADVELLRADLLELHREIVRETIFAGALEEQRAVLSRRLAWMAGACVLGLSLLLASPWLVPGAQYVVIGAILIGVATWIIWGGKRPWMRASAIVVAALLLPVLSAVTAEGRTSQQKSDTTATTTSAATQTDMAKGNSAATETKTQQESSSVKPANDKKPSDPPFTPLTTLTMVAMAGFIGGTISVIRRIQNPAVEGDAIRNLQKLAASQSYIVLGPISGAIFALVLYAFFCGGLLKGSIFPEIGGPPHPPDPISFKDFLTMSGPRTILDQGKVLVWCFIAGFAETFVPDAIDRLTKTADKP